jgi:hypothetical protein
MKLFNVLCNPFTITPAIACFAVEEVFDAGNGVAANFSDGRVEVEVNSSSKGRIATTAGETLGAFLKRQAQTYGVRTFSAYADGLKLTTSDATKPMSGISKVSIVAKDARGRHHDKLKFIWTT